MGVNLTYFSDFVGLKGRYVVKGKEAKERDQREVIRGSQSHHNLFNASLRTFRYYLIVYSKPFLNIELQSVNSRRMQKAHLSTLGKRIS